MKTLEEKVVILAGGKGTRLQPFTATFPKPLVPVGSVPILEILLRQLSLQGFRKVVLTLGYLAELIKAYFAQHKSLSKSMDICFIEEEMPTGTAGSLATVPDLDRTFLVMNGDILTSLDFRQLVDFHKDMGAFLTIATHAKEVQIDLGVMELGSGDQLLRYEEKPIKFYNVSMGIYVYEPGVLSYVSRGEYLDFPALVNRLLEDGKRVQCYRNNAFWLDVGRPEDYSQAQEIFENDPSLFGF